jgi:transcriptional regulator with GAF, ATPase, and Fis domain
MLQEGTFVKVGDSKTSSVDVRIVAATNCNLPEMVSHGEFRGDLYARLNGFDLALPPLRDRREDMGLLISQVLRECDAGDYTISHPAYRALVYYEWPYNIRELHKTLSTAVVLARQQKRIELCHLPEALRELAEEVGTDSEIAKPKVQASSSPWRRVTEPVDPAPQQSFQRPSRKRMTDAELGPMLVEALNRTEGNVSAVARELNTTRMQIHRWMKRLGIDADEYRAEPHQPHSSYRSAQEPR